MNTNATQAKTETNCFLQKDELNKGVDIINSFPQETLQHIFSYLNEKDVRSALALNRRFNAILLTPAKRELALLENFARFLKNHLDINQYGIQVLGLVEADMANKKIQNSMNLGEIEHSVNQLDKLILTLLKDVKEEDLKDLENLYKGEGRPKIGEEIFSIAAKIYRENEPVKDNSGKPLYFSLVNKNKRFEFLLQLCKKAFREKIDGGECFPYTYFEIEVGDLNKVIEIISKLPKDERSNVLREVKRNLLTARYAREAINRIPYANIRAELKSS